MMGFTLHTATSCSPRHLGRPSGTTATKREPRLPTSREDTRDVHLGYYAPAFSPGVLSSATLSCPWMPMHQGHLPVYMEGKWRQKNQKGMLHPGSWPCSGAPCKPHSITVLLVVPFSCHLCRGVRCRRGGHAEHSSLQLVLTEPK